MDPVSSVEVPPRPFNGGHLVVKLSKPIYEMRFEELATLKKKIDSVIQAEKRELRPEGFNIYISDSEIHIIPRWCGDVNVAFFGGMKVIPQSREDLERLAREV